jgi:RNA-directed DNA polymerase
MARPSKYPKELMHRGVRLALEGDRRSRILRLIWGSIPRVLNSIYEADFLGFSYGFRPGRSPHDALDALAVGIERSKVNWVLDADIRDFFGQLDRAWLERFLRHRIADTRILRLIQKWLAAGVIEGGEWSRTSTGPRKGRQ